MDATYVSYGMLNEKNLSALDDLMQMLFTARGESFAREAVRDEQLETRLRNIREVLRTHARDRGMDERQRETWRPIEDCTAAIKAITATRLMVEDRPTALTEVAAILDGSL